MWELDHKEDWAWKNWCFPIVVLEKTLESPLDCKGIKPVNSKGNQPWIFTGRTDAEALPDAEVYLMLKFTWCWYWPPDANNQLIGKKPWIWRLMSTMVDDHHHHHSLCTRIQCFIAGLSPHIWLLAPWEKWWRVKWISSQQPNKMGTIGPLPTGL